MIKVSENCVKCKHCIAVCPVMIIEMGENYPFIADANGKKCIQCGHCVSVCPKAALDHELVPLASQEEIMESVKLATKESEQLLRSVRSVRNYKKKTVEPDIIERIVDMGRYAPTARNTQGVEFVAIMNREKVLQLASMVIDWMEQSIAAGEAWSRPYRGLVIYQKKKGIDMIFRGAPQLVLAMAPFNHPYGEDNARMATVYSRIQATAEGVGTCWAGFFEMYAKARPEELATFLGISTELRVGAAIMLGYASFEYKRVVERKPLRLTFVE